MTRQVHDHGELPEPAARLLDGSRRVAPGWLRRVTCAAATRSGIEIPGDELDEVVAAAADRLLDELGALLATDVDEQRTNPLSVFRLAVDGPTALLLRHGARPAGLDRFSAERFPDDVFGLGPATWSDVDPDLRDPGIAWGAWKAITVLQRRREQGLR